VASSATALSQSRAFLDKRLCRLEKQVLCGRLSYLCWPASTVRLDVDTLPGDLGPRRPGKQSEAGLLLGVARLGAATKDGLAVSEVGCSPGGGFRQACSEIMKYHKHV